MAWDIRGKTVLITGATSGIGLEAAVEMVRRGARVVMVGRDRRKTEGAVAEVKARSGSGEVSFLLCDFSSQVEIRRLAQEILAGHERLDVLINNAGAVNKERRLTAEGIEATFAVNHLGYFLLTNLLTDLLVRSAPARVVSVASEAHRSGTLDFDDLGFERGYSLMGAYSRSKLANILFSNELARRLSGQGVTSNCLHPGVVATNIWSGAPGWIRPPLQLVSRLFFLSPEKGASPIVHLATGPDLDAISGRYFVRHKAATPAPLARDEAAAKRLWTVSAGMVGLPEG